MTDRLFKLLAWSILATIVFVTVSPIELRPSDFSSVDADRFFAFMLLAAIFIIGYSRHFLVCVVALILGTGAIELLQFLSESRHPHADDAAVKAAGAAAGAVLGWAVNRVRLKWA